MSTMARAGFRIALLQLKVGPSKADNLANALTRIRSAVRDNGARVVALPECFNSPYGTQHFAKYAEEIPTGETSRSLSAVAKELGIYLIGGTIPERTQTATYNTCTVWSPEGALLATYRKIHLFDINIPGGITFRESDVLTGGDQLAVIPIDGARVGIGICYDIRFDELARLYRNKGCDMLIYPGAFNMKTGPLHWELLAKARANDTQSYIATISPARDAGAGYIAWGHSMVVDPWAKVVAEAADGEETVVATVVKDEKKKKKVEKVSGAIAGGGKEVKVMKTTTVKDMLRAKRDSLLKMEQQKKGGRSSGTVSSSEAEEEGGDGDEEDEDGSSEASDSDSSESQVGCWKHI